MLDRYFEVKAEVILASDIIVEGVATNISLVYGISAVPIDEGEYETILPKGTNIIDGAKWIIEKYYPNRPYKILDISER